MSRTSFRQSYASDRQESMTHTDTQKIFTPSALLSSVNSVQLFCVTLTITATPTAEWFHMGLIRYLKTMKI